jgi:subfamily B ATP-binding cassette protein HlyB/CyaB
MATSPISSDLGRDPGLTCLLILARWFERAVDGARLQHEFAEGDAPLDDARLVRAARWIGLKARRRSTNLDHLARIPLPAIVGWENDSYAILLGVRGDDLLLQHPLHGAPQRLSRQAFEAQWNGTVIQIGRRGTAATGTQQRHGFAWLLPFVLRYRRQLLEVLSASFVIQLLGLVSPLFFQVVIDKVLAHSGLTTLDVLALGLLLVSVFEVILGGLRSYVLAHTTNRIDVALGAVLFRHLVHLPLAYFGARRVGDIVARLRELETVRSFVTGAALTVTLDLLFTGVFLVVMASYSPTLTLLVSATLPAYGVLTWISTPTLRQRLAERFNRGAENQAYLIETVTTIETLKGLALEPTAQRRWEERLAAYLQASFRAVTLSNITGQLAAFINRLMVLGILWFGAREVMAGTMSVGQLVAFNLLAARLSAPLLRLVQLWQEFQQAALSMRRLGDILKIATEPDHRHRQGAHPALRGALSFSEISFRYPEHPEDILRALSLHIPAGQVVGIIGPSGCGKSTLARLLQRLYTPGSGKLAIDGVDLRLIDPSTLRRQIAVVGPDSALFHQSVRANIALSDPGAPLAAVIRAARLAAAHDFIQTLPEGYDTVIGEHGTALSSGQRQRIALARALFSDPRILILDEATSALDHEAETAVQRNMQLICRDRTVLIIAHRLSALGPATRIVVLNGGRVTEDGPPARLRVSGGYYAALFREQSPATGSAA